MGIASVASYLRHRFFMEHHRDAILSNITFNKDVAKVVDENVRTAANVDFAR